MDTIKVIHSRVLPNPFISMYIENVIQEYTLRAFINCFGIPNHIHGLVDRISMIIECMEQIGHVCGIFSSSLLYLIKYLIYKNEKGNIKY